MKKSLEEIIFDVLSRIRVEGGKMSEKNMEDASRLKSVVRDIVQPHASVSSVCITKFDDAYAVKINLVDLPTDSSSLPSTVEGVKIVYEVVGRVSKRSSLHGGTAG